MVFYCNFVQFGHIYNAFYNMLKIIIYFLPSLLAAVWAAIFIIKKNNTRQKIYLAMLIMQIVYNAGNALFFLPTGNYLGITMIDCLVVPISLATCALSVDYLYLLFPNKKFNSSLHLLLAPSLVAGSMVGLMYYIIGFDNAARLIESFDKAGAVQEEFMDRLYRIYVFLDINFVNLLSIPFYIANLILIAIILVKCKKLARIKAIMVFTGMALLIPYITMGRQFMCSHVLITSLIMILTAAELFFLSYLEYYSEPELLRSPVIDNGAEKDHTISDRTSALHDKFVKAMEDGAYKNHDLTVESMAKMLGIGKTMLSGMIQKTYGTSFRDILNDYRVNAAKKYMTEHPEARQAEVAFECGFKDNSSFNRKFKEKEGCTPLTWAAKSI